MEWVTNNLEVLVPVLVVVVEVVLRKIPKAVPLLALLGKLLDSVPGLKNKE